MNSPFLMSEKEAKKKFWNIFAICITGVVFLALGFAAGTQIARNKYEAEGGLAKRIEEIREAPIMLKLSNGSSTQIVPLEYALNMIQVTQIENFEILEERLIRLEGGQAIIACVARGDEIKQQADGTFSCVSKELQKETKNNS